jgi:RecJ-like exonuclease
LTSSTIDVLKKIADALELSNFSLIFGSDKQIINDKINDPELLQLFHKVQLLNEDNIKSVKAMLNVFVFQKEILKQLS